MNFFVSASLFPSIATPHTGLFVYHRLRALRHYLKDSQFFIASPTPYFPFKHDIFGNYALYARKPKSITNYLDFNICYPRYAQIPATNNRFSGYMTYLSIKNLFANYVAQYGKPSCLIAEYGFPDGIAVYRLSQHYNIPYVITLRGSDMSYFMKLPHVQSQMLQALSHAKAVITVSEDMKNILRDDFNYKHDNIVTIGNGVDSTIFFYNPDTAIRQKYNIKTQFLICSVGGLIPRKNHLIAIKAIEKLPNFSLLIAGEGDLYQQLNAYITQKNLGDRIKLIGSQKQETLRDLYSASDFSILCSLSEGRPNVVLESLACGTPVISSAVQGVNELITAPSYGTIFKTSCDIELSNIIKKQAEMINIFDETNIMQYGHSFSWQKTAEKYANIVC